MKKKELLRTLGQLAYENAKLKHELAKTASTLADANDALDIAGEALGEDYWLALPQIAKVSICQPEVTVDFDDGSFAKSVMPNATDYDAVYGILYATSVRLVGGDEAILDNYVAPILRSIAGGVQEVEDVDGFGVALLACVDAVNIMRNGTDKWIDQLGDPVTDTTDNKHQKMRDEIRKLVDEGELR